MNCAKVRNLLVDYSEGSLAAGKRIAIAEHLSHCDECRAELEQIDKLKAAVSSIETPEQDADFWKRFDARLSQRLADAETEGQPLLAGWRLSWQGGFPVAATGVIAALFIAIILAIPALREQDEPKLRLAQEADGYELSEYSDLAYTDLESDEYDLAEPFLGFEYEDSEYTLADSSTDETEPISEEMVALMDKDMETFVNDLVFDSFYDRSVYDLAEEFSQEATDEEIEELYESFISI